MRALRMEFRSSFRLIRWAGGAAALILTTLLMGCTPGSGEYFWSDRQPVLDLGVPRPLDEASGSFDGEWTFSGTRSSAPSSLRIRWNRRSDGDRIETYSSLSARRLGSLTGGFRSGEVSIIESKAGELTLKAQEWSSISSRVSGTWHFDPDPAYARRQAAIADPQVCRADEQSGHCPDHGPQRRSDQVFVSPHTAGLAGCLGV